MGDSRPWSRHGWAGPTPTVRASDLTVHQGHITKQGSAWLRWILCEAAQTAKRNPAFADTDQDQRKQPAPWHHNRTDHPQTPGALAFSA